MCLWNRVMNTCVAWSMWNYESGYLGFANELTQLAKWLPLTDVWGIFCVMNRRRRGHIIMVYWFLSRCSWSWGMSKKTDLISLVHLRQMKWYLFCIVTSEWETFQFTQKCRFRPCVSRWRSLSRWWSSDAVVTVRWPRVLGMPILQCVIMGWWYGEAKW